MIDVLPGIVSKVLNVVTGVFVDNAQKAAENDVDQVVLEEAETQQKHILQVTDVFRQGVAAYYVAYYFTLSICLCKQDSQPTCLNEQALLAMTAASPFSVDDSG